MSGLPLPLPMLITLGVSVVAVAIALPILIKRNFKGREAEYFRFNREHGIDHANGENLADLLLMDRGGIVIRPQSIFNVRYGRALLERGPKDWRRKSRPASVAAAGFSAALQVEPNGDLFVYPLNRDELNQREMTVAEIAVSESAQRAGGADLVAKLMAVTVALLVIPVVGLVAVLGIEGLNS